LTARHIRKSASNMAWFKNQKSQASNLSRERALAARPVKNSFVDEKENQEGLIRLSYPVTVKPWFARISRLMGHDGEFCSRKMLDLDQMGSAAWRLIDGERSVDELVKNFQVRYGIHKQEAEAAMTAFVRELGRRGLIGLR
jgi:hypothetical protein